MYTLYSVLLAVSSAFCVSLCGCQYYFWYSEDGHWGNKCLLESMPVCKGWLSFAITWVWVLLIWHDLFNQETNCKCMIMTWVCWSLFIDKMHIVKSCAKLPQLYQKIHSSMLKMYVANIIQKLDLLSNIPNTCSFFKKVFKSV